MHAHTQVPRLLLSVVLCSTVRYLTVEWHLNTLPSERRLEGFALRLSLQSLIDRGCQRSGKKGAMPRLLQHER